MLFRCVSETATELATKQTSPIGLFIGLIIIVVTAYLFIRACQD